MSTEQITHLHNAIIAWHELNKARERLGYVTIHILNTDKQSQIGRMLQRIEDMTAECVKVRYLDAIHNATMWLKAHTEMIEQAVDIAEESGGAE